jgi:hypothetical protein
MEFSTHSGIFQQIFHTNLANFWATAAENMIKFYFCPIFTMGQNDEFLRKKIFFFWKL